MAHCVAEDHHRERAVKEVAQVYELIKIKQPLLLLHCSSSTTTHQLAQSLLSEALRALNVALSVMTNQQPATTTIVKAEPSSPSPGGAAAAARSSAGNKRRRSMEAAARNNKNSSSSSWAGLTTVPYDDGYEWRKYGEKKINGSSYSRSYFRCTYKDDTGCLATKYVQQKDSTVFHVTYNNKHTCTCCSTNSTTTAAAAAASMMNNNNIKQEPPAATTMPPLVEACALGFDEQAPAPCHQEPSSFPIISMQQSTTSGSCISGGGESCDEEEYSPGSMMAAEEASAGADDYLSFYDYDYDMNLLLLCDSFKDY